MKKRIIFIFAALLLLLSACVQQSTPPTAAPTAAPTPQPIASPEAPFEETAAAQLRALVTSEVSLSLADAFPENYEAFSIFSNPERAWLAELPAQISEQLFQASESVIAQFRAENGSSLITEHYEWIVDEPSWQLVYALSQGAADAEQAATAILSSYEIEVSLVSEGTQLMPSVCFTLLPYREAIAQCSADEAEQMSRCFTYSYCMTVYDETTAEREYTLPEPDGNLLSGITWPLASHTRLRKTWYAARDDGARKHTGTDIWANADTEIFSCTDGTVTFVGSGDGMGNAVIVTDDYGYEFHYYHMIRQTDFLKAGDRVAAGDLLGHVGNTGNSARDHLHLTIVAPNGILIDPYSYLAEIEPA